MKFEMIGVIVFFLFGFAWNWAVLSGWSRDRLKEKRYRFSSLRAINIFHHGFLRLFNRYPRIKASAQIIPPVVFLGLLALVFKAIVPWWAALLGSITYLGLRQQISFLRH